MAHNSTRVRQVSRTKVKLEVPTYTHLNADLVTRISTSIIRISGMEPRQADLAMVGALYQWEREPSIKIAIEGVVKAATEYTWDHLMGEWEGDRGFKIIKARAILAANTVLRAGRGVV